MTGPAFSADELQALTDSVCDSTLTEHDIVQLERLLRGNVKAQQRYLSQVRLDRWLRLELAHHVQEPTVSDPPSPIPPLLATTLPSTVGFFSSGWPVAYLIATVVCGVSMLIGSLIPTSQPAQLAKQSSLPSRAVAEPQVESVARITGMVDCKWAGTASDSPAVTLGRKYELASGLMEITYDTGAKVILQGPVTYEVESAAGGYLAVGKLTGRVEVEKAKGFTVRTPTTIVTDLGTEFGVEVRETGTTSTHVFRGVVEVRHVAERGQPGQPIRLAENESVRVERQQSDKALKMERGVADSSRFVRSEQLVKLVHERQAKHARTPRLLWPILDKTLVAWVSLANTEQQGVGVLSLVSVPEHEGIAPEYDGIVFGELERGKWMAGSEGWVRSQKDQSACRVETASPGELVQIAIVYDWTSITIYRNGEKYAQYETDKRQIYRDDSILLIGKRHLWHRPDPEPKSGLSALPTLVGTVEEARFYNFTMSPRMIASLRPNEPSPIGPVGWWTFKDGTARDVTGHFPMGELHGNAKIANGKLILDGADSYLLVPAVLKANQQPPANAKALGESNREPKEEFTTKNQ